MLYDNGARHDVGPTFPSWSRRYRRAIIDRGSVNAFDDARTAHANRGDGRKKPDLRGLSLEFAPPFRRFTATVRDSTPMSPYDACGPSTIPSGRSASHDDAGGRDRLRLRDLDDGGHERQTTARGRAVYGAIDMDWAKLVGQLAHAYGK